MKLLAIALALAASAAGAQEAPLYVGMTTVSIHVKTYQSNGETFNNVNPGIYFVKGHYTGGILYNSERSVSVYGGYAIPVNDWLDVVLGAVTGYRAYPILPLVVPSVHYAITDKTTVRLNLVISNVPALNLAFERRF